MVHAAQYKTRHSQAEHVAGRAGPAGARGASQLLGNRRPPPGAGTAGSWNRRGGLKCTNCRAYLASYLEPQGIDPPELQAPSAAHHALPVSGQSSVVRTSHFVVV
jgi:hypothetical protein